MKITDRLIPDERPHAKPSRAGASRVDTRPITPGEPPSLGDGTFNRAVGQARERRDAQVALADRIDALASPDASDPRSYDNQRSIELLQHVMDRVLPALDSDDEILTLANDVIAEELDWRQAWESRLNEASSPRGDLDEEPLA